MSNYISKSDFIDILSETVNSGREFLFTPSGHSMKPMLNGTTDTVLLTKKPEKLNKYDVALYVRRSDNALVLHRVVTVNDESYTMSGDNQYYFDFDIRHDDVLAVVKSFVHNSKTYSVKSLRFIIYSRVILVKKYIRLFISKIYHKVLK